MERISFQRLAQAFAQSAECASQRQKAAPQRGGTEKVQFFSACSGAGMRPPRLTNTDGENVLTGRMGA